MVTTVINHRLSRKRQQIPTNMYESKDANGATVSFGAVSVHKVMKGKSNTSDIAVLKQEITTTYPAVRTANDKVASIFGDEDFGDGQEFKTSRHTIIKCPVDSTVEAVTAKLAEKAPNGHIYRMLSSNIEDVLTAPQKEMIAQGLSTKSMEDYKADRMVRRSEDNTPVLFNGEPQYRNLFFSATPVEDIDMRGVIAPVASERVNIAEEQTVTNDEVVEQPAM